MTTLPYRDTGRGTTVLLVHGVGLGARHLSAVADRVGEHARVIVPDRPGYRRANDLVATSLDDHIDMLIATLESISTAPAIYVGVSGGATLGIGVAARAPELLRGVILHEPLLGSLVPELQAQIRIGSERLANDAGELASVEFVRQLVGREVWTMLDHQDVDEIARLDRIIREEVDAFARVEFSEAELARLRDLPITTTVGRASPPIRHLAATVLAEHSGARVSELPGSHFVPLAAPDAFARAICELLVETEPASA